MPVEAISIADAPTGADLLSWHPVRRVPIPAFRQAANTWSAASSSAG
jgi:hypothetical protein